MIKPLWTVLCEKVLINDKTKAISCIDMVGALCFNKVPKELPGLILCTSWEEQEEKDFDFEVKVSFLSQKGDNLKQIRHHIQAQWARFASINFEIKGQKIQEYGRYCFVVEYKNKRDKKWKNAFNIPLYIVEPQD